MKKNTRVIQIILLVCILATYTVISATSNSANITEWRSEGRTLENNRYYPDTLHSNIAEATINQYTMPSTVYTSPIVADNFLYFSTGTTKRLYQMNYSNYTHEITHFTGSGNTYYSIAIANGYVYLPSGSYIYQLNASNISQQIAVFNAGSTVYAPTIINESAYITSSSAVYRLNATNITQEFERYTASSLFGEPSYSNGYIYVSQSSIGYNFYQLNASNVSQRIASSYSLGRFVSTSPTIHGDYAYACNSRHFTKFNASDVSTLIGYYTYNPSLSVSCYPNPVINNGYAYFAATNPTYIYQVNESNVSQLIGRYNIGASYWRNWITATDNYIYVTAGSYLYQLDANNISNSIGNYSLGSNAIGPTAVDTKLLFARQTTTLYEIVNNRPTTLQNSPPNTYYLNTATTQITFNCSAEYTISLANISLYLTDSSNGNFQLNQTTQISSTTNSSSWTMNLSIGNYTWGCKAVGSDTNYSFSTNRTLIDNYTIYDTTYPTFTSQNDNNASINNSGTGIFNITVLNTNGTVLLEINNTNITATNLTTNTYNVSYNFITNGTYQYKWYAYGNGSSNKINNSQSTTFIVNYQDTIYPIFTDFQDNSGTLTQEGTAIINATISNTNGTAFLEINNINYTTTNTSGIYNISFNISSSGTYNYRWYAYGNGTATNLNTSTQQTYIVNSQSRTSTTQVSSQASNSKGGYIQEKQNSQKEIELNMFILNRPVTHTLQNKNTIVKEIELRSKDWVSGKITITTYNQTPDFCGINYNENYSVYQVLSFNTTFDDEKIDAGRIQFGINKEWIHKNNISEIKTVRCYPEYKEMPSSYKNETPNEGVYDMYITGFSAYAILGTKESQNTQRIVTNQTYQIPIKILLILTTILLCITVIILLKRQKFSLKKHLHNKLFDIQFNIRISWNKRKIKKLQKKEINKT